VVAVVVRPVFAHLVGGALTPDIRALVQVSEIAVLWIISQPRSNRGMALAMVAIGAQGRKNTTPSVGQGRQDVVENTLGEGVVALALPVELAGRNIAQRNWHGVSRVCPDMETPSSRNE
jgi:hypothetical protein